MATMMNMDGYEIECKPDTREEYGDDVMYAGYLPQLVATCEKHVNESGKNMSVPGELASVDVDAFLQMMYKFQRQ